MKDKEDKLIAGATATARMYDWPKSVDCKIDLRSDRSACCAFAGNGGQCTDAIIASIRFMATDPLLDRRSQS